MFYLWAEQTWMIGAELRQSPEVLMGRNREHRGHYLGGRGCGCGSNVVNNIVFGGRVGRLGHVAGGL